MQLTIIDHLFVIALLSYFPVDGLKRFERLKRDSDAGVSGIRPRIYRRTILEFGTILVVLLAYWAMQARSWSLLGLGQPSGDFLWVGLSITGVAIAGLVAQQIYAARVDPAKIREEIAALGFLMPRTSHESRWFTGLSASAGICEEALYRGFLLAYLGTWMGWPLALATSSLIFGLGHVYQGIGGILKTGLLGAILGAIVMLTGSLWAAIVLHALIDWSSGLIGYRAYGTDRGETRLEISA